MSGGKRLPALPTLSQTREHAATQLRELPDPLRSLDPAAPYPVIISEELKALRDQVDASSAIAQHRP
jgi:nicotinate phosphoribosyltransferase